jgi:hypothetical protein
MQRRNYNIGKVMRNVLFDTIFIPENISSNRVALAFQIPMHSYAGRCLKSQQDTNMLCPGMMPAPEKFAVEKLSLALKDSAGWIDTVNRWWDGTISLEVNRAEQVSGLLRDFADRELLDAIKKPPREPDVPLAVEFAMDHCLALLETLEYFCVRLAFDRHISVPMEMVVGLTGLHVTALEDLPSKGDAAVSG